MGKKSQPEPEPEPKPAVYIYALSSGEAAVLPGESWDDLEQLEKELNEQFEPKTNTEQFLVDQMIHARWKLTRVRRLESQAYTDLIDDDGSDSFILDALKTPGNIFDKLDRMAAAADRACSKAVRELAQLRANAQKSKIQNKAKDAEAWLQAELAKLENEPIDHHYIRFGSPEPPNPAPRDLPAPDAPITGSS